jgi:hypothetical protein
VRAKGALERCEQKLTEETGRREGVARQRPAPSRQDVKPAPSPVGELSSPDEQRKFERLAPIDLRDVRACDLDTLCQQLMLGEL